MKKTINKTHLEGYLYGFNLEPRTAGENAKNPGVEFIRGTLEIVTETEGESLNVVPVNFSYVKKTTNAGKANATYATLKNIIENGEGRTYKDCGTEAIKLKVDTALGLNEFYAQDGTLVSYKINDQGFVHIVNEFTNNKNSFEVDIIITNVVHKEEDEEKGTDEHVVINGAVFNFMGNLLPVELTVKDEGGMNYFEGLEPSNAEPVFTKVWGKVLSSTETSTTVEESAFGDAAVTVSTRHLRDWVVTGAITEPYVFGDEDAMTRDELKEAIQNREEYLAQTKARAEEYRAAQQEKENAFSGTASKKESSDDDEDFEF